MTWSGVEGETVGTWSYYDNADTADIVALRFDAEVPSLGTDTLSLRVDEFERACGPGDDTAPAYSLWDALTSTQPALRLEPAVC
ncbi:MAG: hypothetical protein LBU50_07180 [Cellulomonas sp.]|nr:hypothetical protein [Cellulomonas sp.]